MIGSFMTEVESWLLSFKGHRGVLAQLEDLYGQIDVLDEDPARLPSGMSGRRGCGVSDPTARDASSLMARKSRIEADIAELESQVFALAEILHTVEHGNVVGDYYMDASGTITWLLLANDYGVAERTVQRWRSEVVEKLSHIPGIPPMR